MKAEGNMMRHLRPGDLSKRSCIQHEQERSAFLPIEDYREDDALILTYCIRRGHKHRLARVRVLLKPCSGAVLDDVDLDQLV